MAASAPEIVEVDVTDFPVPIAAVAKVPVCVRLTTSGDIIPTKLPPVTDAVTVPSYVLLLATAPDIVKAFAVMFLAVKVGCVKV